MTAAAPSHRRGIFQARVLANRPVCLDHYALTFELESFPPSRAGQFVNIRCGSGDPLADGAAAADWPEGQLPRLTGVELAGRRALLRRPISLAGRRDRPNGAVGLEIIHHVIGVGTAWLAQLESGDPLNLMGPLGNGFEVFPDRPAAALLGGGVGIPPMIYLAETLAAAGKEVVAFAGARTRAALPLSIDPAEPPSQAGWPTLCTGEFAAHGTPTVVATDDGSLGVGAFVDVPFARWLDQRGHTADLAVYACGPEPMMRAVAGLCAQRNVPCLLALERHMACGVGTCQGCTVKVRDDSPAGWKYLLACKDGPVFNASELVW